MYNLSITIIIISYYLIQFNIIIIIICIMMCIDKLATNGIITKP